MNAYVMTPNGVQVVEGAGWLEVHPDDIVLIRCGEPERRPMAAVKLSDRLWVALGERPPVPWSEAGVGSTTTEPVVENAWPPEPPPDVDSEG
jgi:hypothetical protein